MVVLVGYAIEVDCIDQDSTILDFPQYCGRFAARVLRIAVSREQKNTNEQIEHAHAYCGSACEERIGARRESAPEDFTEARCFTSRRYPYT